MERRRSREPHPRGREGEAAVTAPRPLSPGERLFAESRKYGEVIILLPLEDGRFAVMGAGRKPEGTYGPEATLGELEATQPTVTRAPTRALVPVADPSLQGEIEL
jgi:hypothetical protein